MMKRIFLQKKLNIQVPDTVIQATWNLYNHSLKSNFNTYAIEIGKQANGLYDCVTVTEFQINSSGVDFIRATPELPKRDSWKFINDDVNVIDSFIKENFSSAFMFRIDKMLSGTFLRWHKQHIFPKIFIPMHDTVTVFSSKVDEDESTMISNRFELGSCWLWDVRQNHSVDNSQGTIDRFMACFCIDPELETNTEIFV